MSRTIHIDLFDVASIDRAVREIRDYSKWVERKIDELRQRVAELICDHATPFFQDAVVSDTYLVKEDGSSRFESEGPITASVQVTVEPQSDGTTLVIAHGEDAVWIEFGAGVHYNGTVGSYANPLGETAGFISAIGTYGDGNGAKDTWGYYDENHNLHLTHGAPASMPLYNAVMAVVNDIERIAREVFST